MIFKPKCTVQRCPLEAGDDLRLCRYHQKTSHRCTIEGCSDPHRARGLCRRHYVKLTRAGFPPLEKFIEAQKAKVIARTSSTPTCCFVECDQTATRSSMDKGHLKRVHAPKTLCITHYRYLLALSTQSQFSALRAEVINSELPLSA